MKFYLTIIAIIFNSMLLQFCSGKVKDTETLPAVLSFGVVCKDGSTHWADIDRENGTATVESIWSMSSVRTVQYTLTPNTAISPLPEETVSEFGKENVFTLTCGKKKAEFRLLFPNLDEDDTSLMPDPELWELAWYDEFDGNTFNPEVWSKTPRANPDWANTMAPYDELYGVKDGILTLWGIKNTEYPDDDSKSLTGGLWTKDAKAFKGGRIDIRARYDCAQGFWPALWLRPQTATGEYIEIDILEHINFEERAHQTVHSDYTINVDKTELSNTVKYPMDISGWHIYSVELHEDKVVFLVDNKETFSYPRVEFLVSQGQFPFYDVSYYVILSAQLGGKWPGNVNLEQLPVRLEVDYVRHYLPKNR